MVSFDSHSECSSSSSSSGPPAAQPIGSEWTPIAGRSVYPSAVSDDDPSDALPPAEKRSIYVGCFDEMLTAVLANDRGLFTPAELGLFDAWSRLAYPARYLFVRLFIRKNSQWFRIDKLSNYQSELPNLLDACEALAQPIRPSLPRVWHPPLGDTLTFFSLVPTSFPPPSPCHQPMPPIPPAVTASGPSSPCLGPNTIADPEENLLTAFATVTSLFPPSPDLDLEPLLACLTVPELKDLARLHRTNPHTTRDMMIHSLLKTTRGQAILSFNKTSGKHNVSGLAFDSKGRKERQSSGLIPQVLKIIGHAIKLNPHVCTLFARVHLIHTRSTSPPTSQTLTAPLLARFQLRSYPSYIVRRSPYPFFPSREVLLEFEEAILLEGELDSCLDLASSPATAKRREPRESRVVDLEDDKKVRKELREKGMRRAHEIFQDVWIRWKAAVAALHSGSDCHLLQHVKGLNDPELYYRRQFHPAHILTRMVSKGTKTLSHYKNYAGEIEVLITLLRQPYFLRGSRGRWYDRLALVLMTHLSDTTKLQDRCYALEVCEKGLTDAFVHQVWRGAIMRRKNRLKKLLKGEEEPLDQDVAGTKKEKSWKRKSVVGNRVFESLNGAVGVKSVWKSTVNVGQLVSVEELALEHYCGLEEEKDGQGKGFWRGFHCEGSIISTLYTLIFWDVLYADVPGAFQTDYQSAPLDLKSDAFALVRAPLISERMKLIEERGIEEVIYRVKETFQRESRRKTWCIGISNWERFELIELMEILECLQSSKNFIKGVLNLMSHEYEFRRNGFPDLCLWNYEKKQIKFVEVKGPGDSLSNSQIAWLDLLGNEFSVEVEVCDVRNE